MAIISSISRGMFVFSVASVDPSESSDNVAQQGPNDRVSIPQRVSKRVGAIEKLFCDGPNVLEGIENVDPAVSDRL